MMTIADPGGYIDRRRASEKSENTGNGGASWAGWWRRRNSQRRRLWRIGVGRPGLDTRKGPWDATSLILRGETPTTAIVQSRQRVHHNTPSPPRVTQHTRNVCKLAPKRRLSPGPPRRTAAPPARPSVRMACVTAAAEASTPTAVLQDDLPVSRARPRPASRSAL